MQLSRSGYYADFVVYPLAILALLASALVLEGAWRYWTLCAFVLAGVATWTLFEYLLHRHVLHRVPVLHDMHEAHHADPAALVGTPSWLSLLLFLLGALLPAWWGLGSEPASAFTAGMMFGYLCYVGVHHVTHHWRLQPGTFLYWLKHRHARHHFSKTPGNFGVTTPFWDIVFGTDLSNPSRQSRS
jgi:sterol desaturase/sphingolipid hydroxylase (fatty acid hydroxylase superfamily)